MHIAVAVTSVHFGCTDRTRERSWLSMHEAAVVLQIRVRDVRNALRRKELCDVRSSRCRGVGVEQLRARVADRPLACAVLEAIAAGQLHVKPLGLDENPGSLMESWDAIA